MRAYVSGRGTPGRATLAGMLVAFGLAALVPGGGSAAPRAGDGLSSVIASVASGPAPTVHFATALGGGATRTAPGSPLVLREAQAAFDDTVGDAASGPDLRRVEVADDANGNIGIAVHYANRTCASTGDLVFVDLDVDLNAATGAPLGIEYVLFVDIPGNRRGIARWDGSLFQPIAVATLQAGCDAQGFDYWIFNRADVGVATGFDFYVSACVDTSRAQCPDFAPNAPPLWRYQLSGSAPPSPPPPPPAPPPPPPADEVTVDDAPGLPRSTKYTGTSIRHRTLAARIYATMKVVRGGRQLQVACWSAPDWISVLVDLGVPRTRAQLVLGFWLPSQGRFLHLAPSICGNLQALLNSKRGNAQRAFATSVALHEAAHMYGVRNEAEATCYGVQLAYYFSRRIGFTHPAALRMEKLAVRTTRVRAPSGYWNSVHCRDGGRWDIDEENRNLDY